MNTVVENVNKLMDMLVRDNVLHMDMNGRLKYYEEHKEELDKLISNDNRHRHHYVPRCYIKRFTEDSKKRVVVATRAKALSNKKENDVETFSTSINNILLEKDLYKNCSNTEPFTSITTECFYEHIFRLYEDILPMCFNKIEKCGIKTLTDLYTLMIGMYIQYIRTPRMRDTASNIIKNNYYVDRDIKMTEVLNSFAPSDNNDFFIVFCNTILNSEIYTIRNDTDTPFIISDTPVSVIITSTDKEKIMNRNLTIYYPLSKSFAILLLNNDAPSCCSDNIDLSKIKHIKIDRVNEVLALNSFQFFGAYKYIVGRSRNDIVKAYRYIKSKVESTLDDKNIDIANIALDIQGMLSR